MEILNDSQNIVKSLERKFYLAMKAAHNDWNDRSVLVDISSNIESKILYDLIHERNFPMVYIGNDELSTNTAYLKDCHVIHVNSTSSLLHKRILASYAKQYNYSSIIYPSSADSISNDIFSSLLSGKGVNIQNKAVLTHIFDGVEFIQPMKSILRCEMQQYAALKNLSIDSKYEDNITSKFLRERAEDKPSVIRNIVSAASKITPTQIEGKRCYFCLEAAEDEYCTTCSYNLDQLSIEERKKEINIWFEIIKRD